MSRVADLHVGSAVYSSDGEKVGRLRFMVVDPDSETVSHLVLEKGMLLSQDVLAPVTNVNELKYRGIFLSLSSEAVLALPEFNEGRYLQRERGQGGHEGHHQDRGRDDRGDRGDRGDGGGANNGGHRRGRRFRRH